MSAGLNSVSERPHDHTSDYMFALARNDSLLAIDVVNLIVEAAAVELTTRRTITAAMW